LSIRVLALDLERTLIDNAMSGRPRPSLYSFLVICHQHFSRVVVFTTVEEADARAILSELERGGHVPPEMLPHIEYVAWDGEYKDLGFVAGVSPSEVLLVDDDPGSDSAGVLIR
jgi:hypothetical protein